MVVSSRVVRIYHNISIERKSFGDENFLDICEVQTISIPPIKAERLEKIRSKFHIVTSVKASILHPILDCRDGGMLKIKSLLYSICNLLSKNSRLNFTEHKNL